MNDELTRLGLLYELSLTTIKHGDPVVNARDFINKLLSRKALNYGAIWLDSHEEKGVLFFKRLYSSPSQKDQVSIDKEKFNAIFSDSMPVITDATVFEGVGVKGHFCYFKLEEIGILEICSENQKEKVSYESMYPFRDVIDQFTSSLIGGFANQNLKEEINRRKLAEKSLQSHKRKYEQIISNIHLGLLEIDNNETITYANSSFCDLSGYDLVDLVGLKASDLLSNESFSIKRVKEKKNEPEGEGVNTYELLISDNKGNDRWFVVSTVPNYDPMGVQMGLVGVFLDITRQKMLATENEFKDTRIKKLFDLSLDALITINESGRVVEWNKQAEIIFHYAEKEVLGKSVTELIMPEKFKKAHNDGLTNYLKTGHGPVLNKRVEISAVKKNGEEFPIELTIFPLKFQEKHYFTAIIIDITERKKTSTKLQEALEKEKELNKMKSQFISMTSHELRTPLTTIKSNNEIISYLFEQGNISENKNFPKYLRRIDENVNRLTKLVNDILILGKLDSKVVPFNPVKCDVLDFISRKIFPNLTETPVLKVSGDQYKINIDKDLFINILNNLIENAFKYSEASEKRPEMSVNFKKEHLEITIKDNGIGVPLEDQNKMFKSFFRASNVDNVKGTGLGLAIVKEFVELHSGSISVESNLGLGTLFTVVFPKN